MSSKRMFKLSTKTQSKGEACFNALTKDPARLWHYRYGHLSFTGLTTLQQKGIVRYLPHFDTSSKVCGYYIVAKQQRNSFPHATTWRASQILELIHADICGTISPILNSNKRYLITFIDDFSRKTWIYFLAKKSKAFIIFKKYKNQVEKGSSLYIKCTDRVGEFTSHEFNNFCSESGI